MSRTRSTPATFLGVIFENERDTASISAQWLDDRCFVTLFYFKQGMTKFRSAKALGSSISTLVAQFI